MTQPDNTLPPDATSSDMPNDSDSEIEPIAPDDAREAIEKKIQSHMPDWKEQGWMKIYDSNYLVRLHKDRTNLDFQCDLLGNVEIIEREANPMQLGGRLIAWLVLLASLAVALALAILAGFIG
jgi:hypothetical protein